MVPFLSHPKPNPPWHPASAASCHQPSAISHHSSFTTHTTPYLTLLLCSLLTSPSINSLPPPPQLIQTLMIASKSITTTDKIITTHHGNRSTVTYSCNMDVDSHQSHSLRRYGEQDQDAMDISVDDGQDDALKVEYSDPQLNEPAPVPQDAQAVLERPRDDEGRASMVNRQGKDLNQISVFMSFSSICELTSGISGSLYTTQTRFLQRPIVLIQPPCDRRICRPD